MTRRQPDLLAADVYRRWASLAATAETSLTIFSPYLDALVARLIDRGRLDPEAVVVVTDLSPASGADDYPAQLKALSALIKRGVQVRSLPRLHAKVLLVDDKRATIGSQNFTKYARSSKETTSLPDRDISGSDFLTTLIEWRSAAVPVDADLVQALLEQLSQESKAAKAALSALSEAFDDVYDAWLERRRAQEAADAAERAKLAALRRQADAKARLEWIQGLIRKSPVRLAGTYATASRKSIPTGLFDSYESMVADRDCDLLRWRRGPAGTSQVQELARLYMYPVMLADSGRLGYARVGHERITYVFQGLSRGRSFVVGDYRLRLSVTFPRTDLQRRNVQLTFTVPDSLVLRCEVDALFDGATLTPVSVRKGTALADEHPFVATVADFCSPETGQESLAREMFRHFRYSRLDREAHNAQDFFDGRRYRFALIEFAGVPLFVAQRQF